MANDIKGAPAATCWVLREQADDDSSVIGVFASEKDVRSAMHKIFRTKFFEIRRRESDGSLVGECTVNGDEDYVLEAKSYEIGKYPLPKGRDYDDG